MLKANRSRAMTRNACLRRAPIVALLVCGLTASSTGCSFMFTETLPDNPEKLRYFDCTSTPGLAVADGVTAVANGVSAAMTLSQSKEEFERENDDANRDLVAGVSIGVAALVAVSGIYGLIHSERCRRAKSELRERLLAPERRDTKLPAASHVRMPAAGGAPPPATAPTAPPTSHAPAAPATPSAPVAPATGAPAPTSGAPAPDAAAPNPSTGAPPPVTAAPAPATGGQPPLLEFRPAATPPQAGAAP